MVLSVTINQDLYPDQNSSWDPDPDHVYVVSRPQDKDFNFGIAYYNTKNKTTSKFRVGDFFAH